MLNERVKKLSIYDDAKKYAKETFMTIEQAEVRCIYFKKMQEERHLAKICPKCGKQTLEIESGSYEEGISPYVYCENEEGEKVIDKDGNEFFNECDFTSDVTKEYTAINHWYDFDEILSFSIEVEREGLKKIEKQIGCTWNEFVENANREITT